MKEGIRRNAGSDDDDDADAEKGPRAIKEGRPVGVNGIISSKSWFQSQVRSTKLARGGNFGDLDVRLCTRLLDVVRMHGRLICLLHLH